MHAALFRFHPRRGEGHPLHDVEARAVKRSLPGGHGRRASWRQSYRAGNYRAARRGKALHPPSAMIIAAVRICVRRSGRTPRRGSGRRCSLECDCPEMPFCCGGLGKSPTAPGRSLQRLAMWGAFNPNRLLAVFGSVRPAIRWSGLGVIAASVLIARFALPKSQPKARPAALDEMVLAADKALAAAMRTGDLPGRPAAIDAAIHASSMPTGRDSAAAGIPGRSQECRRTAGNRHQGARNFGSLAMMTGKHISAQGSDVLLPRRLGQAKGRLAGVADAGCAGQGRRGRVAALRPIQIAELGAQACDNPCNTHALSGALRGRAGCRQNLSDDNQSYRGP